MFRFKKQHQTALNELGLESAVRPFWTAPGLMSLHSISAQLVVSVSCVI